MQTVITYLALLFTGMVLQAQNTIEVSISDLDSNDGNVKIGLYDSQDNWLSKPLMAKVSDISEEKTAAIFKNVPDGVYAVSIYHDENNNNELDMMMGMMPTEDYGCSNNAKGMFGPPKWEDAKFEVKNGAVKKVAINL